MPTATLDHKTTPKVKKTTKKVADAKIDTSEDPKKPVEEWSRVEIDVFLSKVSTERLLRSSMISWLWSYQPTVDQVTGLTVYGTKNM